MRDHIRRFCRDSETLFLHYVLFIAGMALEAITMFPDVAASVGLVQVVPPAYLGLYTMGIAALTIFARLRRFYEDNDHGLPSGPSA
jgi:hypothetical protein